MSEADNSQQTTTPPGTDAAQTTQQGLQADAGSATAPKADAGAGDPPQTAQTAQPTEETKEPQDRDEQGRFKGVQPRIDELTRRRHEAEREANYWRTVAQGKTAQTSGAPAPAPGKPSPDKFDNYADFVEALTDWKSDQKISKAFADRSAQAAQETAQETFKERVIEFAKATPDYVDVVGNSNVPIADHVAEHLTESEVGPQLAYHLAKNPDIAQRLNAMTPNAAAREVGRLEGLLAKPRSAGDPPPPPAKKLTGAPAPADTSNSGQGRTVRPSVGDLPMKDYIAERAKQGARWAR